MSNLHGRYNINCWTNPVRKRDTAIWSAHADPPLTRHTFCGSSLNSSVIIRFAFLLTDESLTSLAKKVPDLLDYSDENGIIDYNRDVNAMLYRLFDINETSQQYIQEILALKKL